MKTIWKEIVLIAEPSISTETSRNERLLLSLIFNFDLKFTSPFNNRDSFISRNCRQPPVTRDVNSDMTSQAARKVNKSLIAHDLK
jgi:hypothetical protein